MSLFETSPRFLLQEVWEGLEAGSGSRECTDPLLPSSLGAGAWGTAGGPRGLSSRKSLGTVKEAERGFRDEVDMWECLFSMIGSGAHGERLGGETRQHKDGRGEAGSRWAESREHFALCSPESGMVGGV